MAKAKFELIGVNEGAVITGCAVCLKVYATGIPAGYDMQYEREVLITLGGEKTGLLIDEDGFIRGTIVNNLTGLITFSIQPKVFIFTTSTYEVYGPRVVFTLRVLPRYCSTDKLLPIAIGVSESVQKATVRVHRYGQDYIDLLVHPRKGYLLVDIKEIAESFCADSMVQPAVLDKALMPVDSGNFVAMSLEFYHNAGDRIELGVFWVAKGAEAYTVDDNQTVEAYNSSQCPTLGGVRVPDFGLVEKTLYLDRQGENLLIDQIVDERGGFFGISSTVVAAFVDGNTIGVTGTNLSYFGLPSPFWAWSEDGGITWDKRVLTERLEYPPIAIFEYQGQRYLVLKPKRLDSSFTSLIIGWYGTVELPWDYRLASLDVVNNTFVGTLQEEDGTITLISGLDFLSGSFITGMNVPTGPTLNAYARVMAVHIETGTSPVYEPRGLIVYCGRVYYSSNMANGASWYERDTTYEPASAVFAMQQSESTAIAIYPWGGGAKFEIYTGFTAGIGLTFTEFEITEFNGTDVVGVSMDDTVGITVFLNNGECYIIDTYPTPIARSIGYLRAAGAVVGLKRKVILDNTVGFGLGIALTMPAAQMLTHPGIDRVQFFYEVASGDRYYPVDKATLRYAYTWTNALEGPVDFAALMLNANNRDGGFPLVLLSYTNEKGLDETLYFETEINGSLVVERKAAEMSGHLVNLFASTDKMEEIILKGELLSEAEHRRLIRNLANAERVFMYAPTEIAGSAEWRGCFISELKTEFGIDTVGMRSIVAKVRYLRV